jgi:hypothetical protein
LCLKNKKYSNLLKNSTRKRKENAHDYHS